MLRSYPVRMTKSMSNRRIQTRCGDLPSAKHTLGRFLTRRMINDEFDLESRRKRTGYRWRERKDVASGTEARFR